MNNKSREISMIGLMVALLCVTAYISFPIPGTPIMITAQTIIINLIGLTLIPKKGAYAIITFFLLGAIGVPVFSGGRAGLGVLFGPSGGYFLGFLVAVIVMAYLRGKSISLKKYLFITICVGLPIILILGATWMSVYNGIGIIKTIEVAVLPFIIGDLIKAIVASIIALRINKLQFMR
jgi:biotin transport system substrate-specific component